MKNSLFAFSILILLCFHPSHVTAQSPFSIGFKGGLNVPNLKSSSTNPFIRGWKTRLSPYFGSVASYQISKRLFVQAELNYSLQGAQKKGLQTLPVSMLIHSVPPGIPDTVYATFSDVANLHYIELPVLLKVQFPLNESISLFINGGPYVSYLLRAKNITSGGGRIYADMQQSHALTPDISFDATTDIKYQLKKFNAGVQLGIGLSMNTKGGIYFLTTGGNIGLVPIQKDLRNGKNTTGAANITLGYLFHLRKI